jgi:hypothetical protein
VFAALFGPELSDLPLRLPISAARN